MEGSWECLGVSVRTRWLSFGLGPQLKLFLNRKSCLEKLITQQEVSFFRWVGDVLPAWKQHVLEMAELRVAGAVECWAESGQAVMVLGALLKETEGSGSCAEVGALARCDLVSVCRDLQPGVETRGGSQVKQRLGRGSVGWGVAVWRR